MNIFDHDKINQISRLLQERKQTVAVAESCTSGLIQNALSQAPEATSVFQGGMTLYNLGQKAKHLNVNPVFAETCNSVSKGISEKMALEVALAFNAELGLAITGYAAPVAELSIKNCYAYIAIAEQSNIIVSKRVKGDPRKSLFENQSVFMKKAIDSLMEILKGE